MRKLLLLFAFVLVGTQLNGRDITFFSIGDTQYGGGGSQNADKNKYARQAILAAIENMRWPENSSFAGQKLEPRGLVMPGDLTQNGTIEELEGYMQTFYTLPMPVYDGLGNHDFKSAETVYAIINKLNDKRKDFPDIIKRDDKGHYAWMWEDVLFIQLNLKPSDVVKGKYDPMFALTFLKNTLSEFATPKTPIVILSHYGVDPYGRRKKKKWWGKSERSDFLETIEGYNVIAFIHGHHHGTYFYKWHGIDCFNVGSPFYNNYIEGGEWKELGDEVTEGAKAAWKSVKTFKKNKKKRVYSAYYNRDNKGHFTVFRITDEYLEAYDVGFGQKEKSKKPYWDTKWENISTHKTGFFKKSLAQPVSFFQKLGNKIKFAFSGLFKRKA